MSSTTTSATLLSRVRDPADQAAWREFETRYGDLIVHFCRRRGLQVFDAEDIRQIVLMRLANVLRAFHHDRARGRFRTFLGCIVRNEIARYFQRPIPATNGVDISADGQATAGEAAGDLMNDPWEREWACHHLRVALQKLRGTHDARSIAAFDRLLAGESVEAVARDMGLTTDAVHKIKQRVRDRLRELVAEQIQDEELPDA